MRPALDRFGEDRGRLARVLDRGRVGGVDLAIVVAAAAERADLFVAQMLDHLERARILAEEVLANVGAALERIALPFAVDRVVHVLDQRPVVVLGEQGVPLTAPDHLDHVPAGAGEDRLQLLDDLAVAAHRAVEPLQVAVDHERQVVELLARGKRQSTRRLGLVHLAVAEERPHAAVRGVLDLASIEVTVEARLVDCVDRAEPHRHRRELPEFGHQSRMRVGRQPLAGLDLAAEVLEVVLRQAAFEERAAVDPGCGVTLEEDLVAEAALGLAVEEVVESDFVEAGARSVGRKVPADPGETLVRAQHHDRGVPANDPPDAQLHGFVARELRFLLGRDRVDVARLDEPRQPDSQLAGALEQTPQNELGALVTHALGDVVEGVEPLLGFLWIQVRELALETLEVDARDLVLLGWFRGVGLVAGLGAHLGLIGVVVSSVGQEGVGGPAPGISFRPLQCHGIYRDCGGAQSPAATSR